MIPDTIFALATAPGRSAIAVVRISGASAHTALREMCGGRAMPIAKRLSRRILVSPFSGERLDDAMLVRFDAPETYTGEDVAELYLHGGTAVVSAVLDTLSQMSNLRQAEAGEFTQRSFLNDRLNLIEAEGIADLIDARTTAQAKQGLAQSLGSLSQKVESWKKRLISALAECEAAIDFADEGDVMIRHLPQPHRISNAICEEINAVNTSFHRGELTRNGVSVVLCGTPNAGKSTLFNTLARRDVAIVSSIAGTTRDAIEVHLDLNGVPITLIDTAGIRAKRDIADEVESEGIRRALARAANANIVLWLDPAESNCTVSTVLADTSENTKLGDNLTALELSEDTRVIRLLTKFDLVSQINDDAQPCALNDAAGTSDTSSPAVLAISAKTGFGIEGLLDDIEKTARVLIQDDLEPALVTRQRHRNELLSVISYLEEIRSDTSLEIQAESLRLAIRSLGRLSGNVDVEDILDVVFSEFCIGK